MTDERYRPGFMNEEENSREQTRQKDMVESIARGYSRAQEKKVLKRLSQLLEVLEKRTQDLKEITKQLKNIIQNDKTQKPSPPHRFSTNTTYASEGSEKNQVTQNNTV